MLSVVTLKSHDLCVVSLPFYFWWLDWTGRLWWWTKHVRITNFSWSKTIFSTVIHKARGLSRGNQGDAKDFVRAGPQKYIITAALYWICLKWQKSENILFVYFHFVDVRFVSHFKDLCWTVEQTSSSHCKHMLPSLTVYLPPKRWWWWWCLFIIPI